MAEWSGGGGVGGDGDDFAGGLTKGRSGRRKHWKLPDMIQGVRHRFRDRMTGRSKSPDSTLEDSAIFRGSQTSVYRMTTGNERTTYTSFASTTSLPRAASLLSTDYGFNDWGLEELQPAATNNHPANSGLPPANHPANSSLPPVNNPLTASAATTITVHRPAATPQLNSGYNSGGGMTSFLGGSDPFPGYPHRPPAPSRRQPPPAGGATTTTPCAGYSAASLTRNNSFGSGSLEHSQQSAVQTHCRPSAIGRTMSVNLVNHVGAEGCDVTSGGHHPVRNGLMGVVGSSGSIPRGKSVRFGENRISVFLQDSTQALEECVRLALSYAEESKGSSRGGGSSSGGDYCSDSEAVILSRQLANHHQSSLADPRQLPPPRSGRQFWSDSEDRHDGDDGGSSRTTTALPSGGRYVSYSHSSAGGSSRRRDTADGCGNGFDGGGKNPATPTTTTDYRPTRMTFGQAVNSLDRGVERSSSSSDRHRRQRHRTTTHINEIFSFIDKVLSGCENGCSDEACPMARRRRNVTMNSEGGGRRYDNDDSGGGRPAQQSDEAASYTFPDRPQPHLEVQETLSAIYCTVV